MQTIYKYPLQITDLQTIELTACAGLTAREQILCVNTQHGEAFLWALADRNTSEPKRKVTITIHGTGHDIIIDTPRKNYIGSFMLFNGGFVGHVFLVNEVDAS